MGYVEDVTEQERNMEMTDKDVIKEALENDREALIDGISQIYNCREVDVDETGAVWIADPQTGHWLDEDGLAKIARALKTGDI